LAFELAAKPPVSIESVPKPAPELAPKEGRKFVKILVYLQREKVIPKSINVQEKNPIYQHYTK